MSNKILIVGAGIGGLSATIALGLANKSVSIIEQSAQLGEVGAGVQLGPNVTKILQRWGVVQTLETYAFEPSSLEVYGAKSGKLLANLALGQSFRTRYGSPYLTSHRADLHASLLSNVKKFGYADIHLNQRLQDVQSGPETVQVVVQDTKADTSLTPIAQNYDALIGADGVWSKVRDVLFASHSASMDSNAVGFSGDLAYRSLVLQKMLPAHLRTYSVKVWLGPDMHLVQYPIRGGEWLNSVLILSAAQKDQARCTAPRDVLSALDWTINMSQDEKASNIQSILNATCPIIQDTLRAIETWNVWPIMKSKPLSSSVQMAQGRVGLLGDAAHPMLPYLAQGAGMAIEDAFELGEQFKVNGLGASSSSVQSTLATYAAKRWARNAQVQKRALLNAELFHADHSLAWARDRSLRLFGAKLLDMPWLYGYEA